MSQGRKASLETLEMTTGGGGRQLFSIEQTLTVMTPHFQPP